MNTKVLGRGRGRGLAGLFLVAALGVGAGCKSGGGQGGPGMDSGGDTPDGTPTLPTLFTDPAVPRCNRGPTSELHGLLDGQRVDDTTTLASNLDASAFQVLEVVGSSVRLNIVLTWSQPLAENTAIPLTGQNMIMREGQPFATQSFCITAGEFGSPALAAGAAGRTLLFRITGARRGDCDGPEVPAALAGCDFRTSTFFPTGTGDAGPGDAGDGGDAGSARQCMSPSSADAGAQCSVFDLTGPWCTREPFTVADGGVTVDGGAVEGPTGGTLVDGDYDLVRYRSSGTGRTRRTMRLLDGATRVEWAADIDSPATGMVSFRYNTTVTRAGNVLTVAAPSCESNSDASFIMTRYAYTAAGDDLTLYAIDDATGVFYVVLSYRRICTR